MSHSFDLTLITLRQLYPKATKFGERKITANILLKVTDLSTYQKPTFDFLLVNNTNLNHISHCFQLLPIIGHIFAFDMGTSFNALVRGEPLNSGLRNLATEK